MDVTTTHPAYADRKARLDFALAHYTGEVYEPVANAAGSAQATRRASVVGMKAEPFLIMHGQGESEAAFAERRRISTHTPHLAFAADSLAGQVLAREAEAERTWETDDGPGVLGDPDDPGSPMARLWEDADGAGTNWLTQFAALAPHLIVSTAAGWFQYVDAGDPATGTPHRHVLVDPRDVIDWHAPGGRLEWAVVKERSLADRAPGQKAEPVVSYLVLDPFGWARYQEAEGSGEAIVGEGEWAYVDRDGRPTVPARFAAVPIPRDLGYQMAREANGIMNLMSTRDFRLWTANTNKMHLDGGDSSAADMEVYAESLRTNGQSLIMTRGGGTATYIHPSQEPAIAANEILGDRVKAFYHTFFRSYSDAAAAQRTATEIRQEADSGTNAFLAMLAGALDEAENWALFTLEQAVAPDRPAEWGRAYVARTRRFDPAAPEAQAEALWAQFFGSGPVPVGPKGRAAAAQRIAELHNVAADPDEIEAAVQEADRPAVRPDRLADLRARMQYDPAQA